MNASAWNAVDVAVLVLLLYSLLSGLVRGLSGEIARAAAFLGLLAAVYFTHTPVGHWLDQRTRLGAGDAAIVALALLGVAALFIYLVGQALLRGCGKLRFHGGFERIGGALAGLVRGAVTAAAILIAVGLLPVDAIHRTVAEDSMFGRAAHRLFPQTVEWVAERLDRPDDSDAWYEGEPTPYEGLDEP